ncbi:hypothetical protein [Enterococcus faecium]|uniref:hypothetical protein n=1 Tax=Enterococcus faecium TaxID=1352 RepID=UPI0001B6E54C|nr:hypothetical protein [Enterococcus faecium]EEV48099.1 predicted protein [Enterococcus faecium 1,231,501]EGP5134658.1 hypothetical protein [Enterococcus faecium]KST43440.1 hypothetical protein AOY34_01280 [Enterococcus faecium]MDQ8399777.1 hypothetical protein [Enterococcus faecium]MDT6387140.1 hypothetical protein [Enterococcus faecium]
MSKFKEKVLSEISFAMVDDAPDLQKLYDKVAAIDEHPALNDNQKIVLDWMKEKTIEENHGFEFALWWTLDAFGTDEPVVHELEVFRNMNSIQRKEVLVAFIAWVQEREEVG